MRLDTEQRLQRAREFGFRAHDLPSQRFVAKPESHDDGPGHGLFLGPVGGPAFSRDLSGRFSRWHLHPGDHVIADVDEAFLAVGWFDGAQRHCARLRRDEAVTHEVAALNPLSHEEFTFSGAPFRVVLTCFSPVLPGDEDASAYPAVIMDVHVEPLPGTEMLPQVDVALFWPNLCGWRASTVTSTDRGDLAWPGLHHAGNLNRAADPAGAGVVQGRTPAVGAGDSEVGLAVGGDADAYTSQVQFRVNPMATGIALEQQEYTLGAVYDAFARTGRLGAGPDASWPAHWHEPVGSALAAHHDPGRGSAHARFTIGFCWPDVTFGQGRRWRRKYAATEGRGAESIATRAVSEADGWLDSIDAWHGRTLEALSGAGWPPDVAGCVVNELNLVVSLGSAWVDGAAAGHVPELSPCSGEEHLGLLEGFDEGYFYYNTSDLWHYAFPALTYTWPRLGELIFGDLDSALDAEVTEQRPIYRPAEPRPMLVADKIPHDLGNPLEDPFVRINGYSMRDDPNTWRDSNPAYVLATVVNHRLAGRDLSDASWRRLQRAAAVAARQTGDEGVPRHDEFGDSTWDNLGLRGHSTYAAGLCTGMWAVLADLAAARGEDQGEYRNRAQRASSVLDKLWNGRYFRAASEGKYADAIMPDSLIGLFYADVAGVPDLVSGERIRSHLRTAYEFAHRSYADGSVGPLLIAEEELREYEGDGGQELQVNEVIVGSGWMHAAMLARYGLRDEANDVAHALRDVLYGGSGLQFRTPAAVNAAGEFRAPLNMRPLAVWWLFALAR